jgi:hypothetical protein
MQLIVSLPTGSEQMTMTTLMVMTLMVVVILQFIRSMKQLYTLLWEEKGQQRLEQMGKIQKIVTSAGWQDQYPDGPSSMDFAEIEPEELPLSQWDAAVQEKCQQALAERNKAFATQIFIPLIGSAVLLMLWRKNPEVQKSKASGKHVSNEISPALQKIIWNLPPSATNHFPGKLSLCIGMPVIIRNNDATELCITKGQEGHVVGWQAGRGIHGQHVLDTLFIKLDKPAKIVKIDGLPENVVPITRGSKNIECTFASDLKEYIHRSQVWVLLNFSMTDYTSQGKTRPKNSVDLSNCRSHQSYYTCLSRSATASGTVIVQSFSPRLITCGASGHLRQEFRELELLDEITKLRYEGKLPDDIQGKFRNPLIRAYQKWKGTDYVPPLTHPALTWSVKDPMPLLSVVTDAPWQIIDKKKKREVKIEITSIQSGFVAAKGSVPVKSEKKRKLDEPENQSESAKKTKAAPMVMASDNSSSPDGLIWDGDNYSCAYDALFTIIYEIWSTDTKAWTRRFKEINQLHLKSVPACFKKNMNGQTSFETARDTIRHEIHSQSPIQFPYGNNSTSGSALASQFLPLRILWPSQVPNVPVVNILNHPLMTD